MDHTNELVLNRLLLGNLYHTHLQTMLLDFTNITDSAVDRFLSKQLEWNEFARWLKPVNGADVDCSKTVLQYRCQGEIFLPL